jgi:hypothetical protein
VCGNAFRTRALFIGPARLTGSFSWFLEAFLWFFVVFSIYWGFRYFSGFKFFCSDLNLFWFKKIGNSKFVQIHFFHIQNLFKFEICSNMKNVQIRILFIYEFCSNLITDRIQILFIYEICSFSIFVHIPNFFKFEKCSVLKMFRSDNIWITNNGKKKQRRETVTFYWARLVRPM